MNPMPRLGSLSQYKQKGFTLLELLIAVSLSAVLMTVLVVGLNTITRNWEKMGHKLDEKIDESLLLLQLEKALIGSYPYYFKSNKLAKEKLFFSGDDDQLNWISTVSPDHTSGYKLWSLTVNPDGGFYMDILPLLPGDIKRQLSDYQDKLGDRDLFFPDYKLSLNYLSESKQKTKKWNTSWNGKEKNVLPIGVRIQFTTIGVEKEQAKDTSYDVFAFIRAKGDKNKQSAFGGGSRPSPPRTADSDGSNNNRKGLGL